MERLSQNDAARLRGIAAKYPAVAGTLLQRFANRSSLRTYVLEVAALYPLSAAADGANDELASALVWGLGALDQTNYPIAEWETLFTETESTRQ